MQSWLEGRFWVGKGAQAKGMTASLRIQASKADSNTWESFTRSGLKLESVHQESPRSDVFRKRATKPLLKQRPRQKHLTWAVEKKNWTVAQWSKVLFSDKSKFCISFGNQGLKSGGRLRHRIQAAWSPVWSFRSQWWLGVPWRLLVLVHCVLSSPKSMQPSTRRFWSTLCFHLLTSFMEMLISFSSMTVAPAHSAKTTSKCFADHDIAVLEPHMESMGYFQEKDEKQSIQKSRRAEGSIVPQQCHRLIASMPHLTDAGVCVKGAPTKYWVHKSTYFKRTLTFLFCQSYFWWILGNILIFWDTGFLTFISCKL